MGTIELLNNDTLGIKPNAFNPQVVALIKTIPTIRLDPIRRVWFCGIDGATTPILLEVVDKLMLAGFECDTGVMARLTDFTGLKIDFNDPKYPILGKLYPYQREIVEFMAGNGSTLNASFVGSGKTLTSLAVCTALKAKRVLIIAPKSVVLQWVEQEIPKWLPDSSVSAYSRNLPSWSKYTVIGYERARIDISLLEQVEWDIIITDESHRLANPNTKLYKALQKLKSKYRFALTATPIMNKAEDMYGLINWLRPGSLGNHSAFLNRYSIKGGFQGRQLLGYKNLNELAQRTAPFIIRKTLDEVDLQLPPYTETVLPVELSPPERKLYEDIRAELLFEIEAALINRIDNPDMLQLSVVKMGKLLELCDSMELLGEEVTSSKLEVLKEHLESTLQNGQKAIIITRFSRMATILERVLSGYSPLLITGQTANRGAIINNFRDDPNKSILIGTEAIAQGLNLQVANILYNYDSAWNPAKMEQRAGRVYRNGQQKPVFIYNLVVKKSLEVWMQKKLEAKAELSASLLPKTLTELKEILN